MEPAASFPTYFGFTGSQGLLQNFKRCPVVRYPPLHCPNWVKPANLLLPLMLQAYKYALLPTEEQQQQLARFCVHSAERFLKN
jgi:hypothetical protein